MIEVSSLRWSQPSIISSAESTYAFKLMACIELARKHDQDSRCYTPAYMVSCTCDIYDLAEESRIDTAIDRMARKERIIGELSDG